MWRPDCLGTASPEGANGGIAVGIFALVQRRRPDPAAFRISAGNARSMTINSYSAAGPGRAFRPVICGYPALQLAALRGQSGLVLLETRLNVLENQTTGVDCGPNKVWPSPPAARSTN